ncbi:XdhC family protein [Photobacterium sp. TLY01]|uniref:XdhC family protein n=1 Tax=Photobacterium sp. TLY01 TaxID=2907534 RepID=UPI001F2B0F1E|nr:XdhC/CoxI family protein [Photobacterium sp. TLY01]UIP28789.1 XdhC family protein [Photobacterium sp. TLY01]
MSNHLLSLLTQWRDLKDEANWVLGTVYKTEGPAYRKSGAMMLFSDAGHQLGMLSGGCLESDIHLHARKAIVSQRAVTLTYDGSDEDDVAFQLGIGCGGTVYILLQPLTERNQYLGLLQVVDALHDYRKGYYFQKISNKDIVARFMAEPMHSDHPSLRAQLLVQDDGLWLCTPIKAPLHLLIVGGGIDARPVAQLAHQLGWRVSLWDPRPANGRREYFPHLAQRLSGEARELSDYCLTHHVSAAVLMSHNATLDAEALAALAALAGAELKYLALLGPVNRRERVIELSGIDTGKLPVPLSGPAGLDVGAELPETIALSILAECQAVITHTSARSLSGISTTGEMRRHGI